MTESADRTIRAVTQIVIAWLHAHAVEPTALPRLIRDIHRSLTGLETDNVRENPGEVGAAKSRPTVRVDVAIQKSVFADHLVCLEDGKRVTMLKRHLKTAHGLTPELYRIKWSLPATYPMVAPAWFQSKSSSGTASRFGLTMTRDAGNSVPLEKPE